MLLWSKIEDGSLTLALESVNLKDHTSKLVDQIRSSLGTLAQVFYNP